MDNIYPTWQDQSSTARPWDRQPTFVETRLCNYFHLVLESKTDLLETSGILGNVIGWRDACFRSSKICRVRSEYQWQVLASYEFHIPKPRSLHQNKAKHVNIWKLNWKNRMAVISTIGHTGAVRSHHLCQSDPDHTHTFLWCLWDAFPASEYFYHPVGPFVAIMQMAPLLQLHSHERTVHPPCWR